MTKSESSAEDLLQNESSLSVYNVSKGCTGNENSTYKSNCPGNVEASHYLTSEKDRDNKHLPFEQYKRRTTVVVVREKFLDVVCNALAEYKYVGPNQRADLNLACRYVFLANLWI